MTTSYKIRVYEAAPNGTNDIEILNQYNESIETICEATFGIMDVYRDSGKIIPLKRVIDHLAVSPLSGEIDVLEQLMPYFPSVRKIALDIIRDSEKGQILLYLLKDGYKGKASLVVPSIVEDAAEQLGICDDISYEEIDEVCRDAECYLGDEIMQMSQTAIALHNIK